MQVKPLSAFLPYRLQNHPSISYGTLRMKHLAIQESAPCRLTDLFSSQRPVLSSHCRFYVSHVQDCSILYIPKSMIHHSSLHFLAFPLLIGRLTVKPNSYKCDPATDSHPDARYPYPTCADLPAAGPFIVSKVPDSHFPLDVDVR